MSPQGITATYQVIVHSIITSALLDTGEHISVMSKRFFRLLLQTPQLIKVGMCKVASASGASLGPIGQYDLTFRFGNK